MTRPAPSFDRGRLRVQGDARPISIGTVTLLATVKFADVRPLTIKLKIDAKRKWALTDRIREIMAEYMGQVLLAERLADHAATLKLLPLIAKSCDRLADQLSMLSRETLRAIELNRFEPNDDPNVPLFEMLPLVRKLRRLAWASERTRASMKRNRKGPPDKKLVDETVLKLVDAIQAARCPVEVINSGSAEPRRQLKGAGGELLIAVFKQFDAHIGEPQICGSIQRLKRRKTAAHPATPGA